MVTVVRGSPEDYKVGPVSRRTNWDNPNCVPFTEAAHTTHIVPAMDVLRQGNLAAGLVYDDSHLNRDRIPVVWLSPNHWAIGYRYGNVQFNFPWEAAVAGKRAYWVEVANYKIPAVRILLTDHDRQGHPHLTPYDPSVGDGPWWVDGGTHYFNNTVCVEFMLEGDLPLAHSSGLHFVRHHSKYCCVHRTSPHTCRELGAPDDLGASRFLARVAAEGIDVRSAPFDPDDLAHRCSSLLWRLANDKWAYTGSTRNADPEADCYARALLSAYAHYHDEDRNSLASLFSSQDQAEMACKRVLAAALGRTEEQITSA